MKTPKTNKIEIESNVNYRPSKQAGGTWADKAAGAIKRFFDSAQILVITLGFLVLVYLFVASFSIVDGPSMLPNFTSGDLTIYEKITTTTGNLKRGDVIVFYEDKSGKDFIKRVIGLPGDTVKVQGGKVYVNGIALNEPYLSEENQNVNPGSVFQEGLDITAGTDKYIVFGDNRHVSLDSRNLGPIDKSKLKGKVLLVFWPLNKIHMVEHVRHPELGDK